MSGYCEKCGETVCTCALDQILHDPENQPSQYGTVPLEMYERLESDPAFQFCHRFAILIECILSAQNPEKYWTEAHTLLDEYNKAQYAWEHANGIPYISGFGK